MKSKPEIGAGIRRLKGVDDGTEAGEGSIGAPVRHAVKADVEQAGVMVRHEIGGQVEDLTQERAGLVLVKGAEKRTHEVGEFGSRSSRTMAAGCMSVATATCLGRARAWARSAVIRSSNPAMRD